jgi:hypothetical protein
MNNVPQVVVPNQTMCCGSVHAKIFEILLILGYILSIAGLAVNIVLTMYCFKYSYSIFFIEIGLAALNLFCLIFVIILRVWRSNGSVQSINNSGSLCLSSVILVFSIIILLGSGAEDGLFYYTISFLTGDIEKEISDLDTNIFLKIFNKNEDMVKYEIFEKIEESKSKQQILRLLPWISINFNALIQILSIFFICIIRQRIKFKTDLGSSQVVQTQVAQELNPNKTNSQRNSKANLGLSNNNGNLYEDIKLKKPRKKKKNKDEKENGLGNSDNIDIVAQKKGKKKNSKKKNKSKDKSKRNSKNKIK